MDENGNSYATYREAAKAQRANFGAASSLKAGRPGYFEAFDEEVEILRGPEPAENYQYRYPDEYYAFLMDGINLRHGAEPSDMAYLVKHEDGTLSIIGVGDVFEGGREVNE
jgi:hypothetical protein